LLTVSRLTG